MGSHDFPGTTALAPWTPVNAVPTARATGIPFCVVSDREILFLIIEQPVDLETLPIHLEQRCQMGWEDRSLLSMHNDLLGASSLPTSEPTHQQSRAPEAATGSDELRRTPYSRLVAAEAYWRISPPWLEETFDKHRLEQALC